MKDLPEELKVIKNSIRQKDPWLILLEITLNDIPGTLLRLVKNTEDVVIGGETYTAFNFNLEMNKVSNSGELPSLKISVSNIERTLQGYLEDLDGMIGSSVKIIIVNEAEPNLDYAELEQSWDVVQTTVNQNTVDFQLSLPNLLRVRYPLTRFIANHCSHIYKEIECGYIGSNPACKRTLDDCRAHNNTARYGGYPGLSNNGIRVV
jgi:lambda family phage minor tail protein L